MTLTQERVISVIKIDKIAKKCGGLALGTNIPGYKNIFIQ